MIFSSAELHVALAEAGRDVGLTTTCRWRLTRLIADGPVAGFQRHHLATAAPSRSATTARSAATARRRRLRNCASARTRTS